MEQSRRFRVMDLLLLALSVLLAVGVVTFLRPCAPMEDGSFMKCHWAARAVLGVGGALAVQALLLAVWRDRGVKRGLSLGMVPTALLAALLPGGLIDLCGHGDARCQTITRPGCLVIGVIIAGLALVNFIFLHGKGRNGNK